MGRGWKSTWGAKDGEGREGRRRGLVSPHGPGRAGELRDGAVADDLRGAWRPFAPRHEQAGGRAREAGMARGVTTQCKNTSVRRHDLTPPRSGPSAHLVRVGRSEAIGPIGPTRVCGEPGRCRSRSRSRQRATQTSALEAVRRGKGCGGGRAAGGRVTACWSGGVSGSPCGRPARPDRDPRHHT